MIYAQLDDNNTVIGISELAAEVIQANMIEIASYDTNLLGCTYDNGTFIPPLVATMEVMLPANPVQNGTPITVNVAVKDQNGNLLPVAHTYYCPVLRKGDNKQSAFLIFTFTNGEASATFSIAEPGIYTVSLDAIHPTPTARLPESPIIITI